MAVFLEFEGLCKSFLGGRAINALALAQILLITFGKTISTILSLSTQYFVTYQQFTSDKYASLSRSQNARGRLLNPPLPTGFDNPAGANCDLLRLSLIVFDLLFILAVLFLPGGFIWERTQEALAPRRSRLKEFRLHPQKRNLLEPLAPWPKMKGGLPMV